MISYHSDGTWYPGDNGLENTIIPARAGYTFNGHYTGQNGTGTKGYEANGAAVSTNFNNSGLTLYAFWTPITYTITFNKDGGTGTANNITATYDQSYTLPAAQTKTGYTFAGWKIGNKTSGAGASVSNLTTTNGATVTATAQWTPITYSVKCDPNGGSGGGTGTATYGVNYKLPAAASYSGFTFLGWNTKADGTGTNYGAGTNVSNLTTTSGTTVTLYAKWQTNATISVNSEKLIIDAFKWAPTDGKTASTVTMTGNINLTDCSSGNNQYGGGAVYLNNNAHFTMNGGTIKDCTAVQYAGAVRVYNNSSFTMNGGTISGCKVTSTATGVSKGGALYVAGTQSTFIVPLE